MFQYAVVTPDFADQWQALSLEGVRRYPLGYLVSEEEIVHRDLDMCQRILGGKTIRGVYDDTRLIGYCGFRPLGPQSTRHRGGIGPVFVTEEYQGSGAADVLISGVMKEAVHYGMERLELEVETQNARAIAFYEKHGFQRIALHPDGARFDGTVHDYFLYHRILDRPQQDI